MSIHLWISAHVAEYTVQTECRCRVCFTPVTTCLGCLPNTLFQLWLLTLLLCLKSYSVSIHILILCPYWSPQLSFVLVWHLTPVLFNANQSSSLPFFWSTRFRPSWLHSVKILVPYTLEYCVKYIEHTQVLPGERIHTYATQSILYICFILNHILQLQPYANLLESLTETQ